ncbi:hypothetical protein, partial [Ruminococcus sp.]
MINDLLKNMIMKKIDFIKDSFSNAIIVLKGIPIEDMNLPNSGDIDLEKIAKDKLSYFINIKDKRNIITYEEFLMLRVF